MSASTPILKSNNVSPIPSLKEGGGKGEPSVPSKKVRVSTTLPSKYGKFIQFGYFLMNKLNASVEGQEEGEIVVDEKVFLDKLHIFESLPYQQAFVQEFFDSTKSISDDMRKLLQQHKKNITKTAKAADKPIKEKKTRQSKKPNVEEDSTKNPVDTVDKKPRGKPKKVATSEDQLVNELVQLAAGPPPTKKDDAKEAVTTLLQATAKSMADKSMADKSMADKSMADKSMADLHPNEPTNNLVSEPTNNLVSEPTNNLVNEPTNNLVNEPTNNLVNEPKQPKSVKQPKQPTNNLVNEPKQPKSVKQPKPKPLKEHKQPNPNSNTIHTNTNTNTNTNITIHDNLNLNLNLNHNLNDNDTIHVSVFEFNQQKYLIDDDLLFVYDLHSQNKIGQFINNNIQLF